ncbi:MAG: V-type ATP synthase subunit E family protein [Peptococcia bacterium]
MPNAQKIKSRILEEAQEAAARIIAEAEAQAKENITAAQKEADEILRQADQEATIAAVELRKHKLAAVESEMRKGLLTVRRNLLDSAFAKAVDKLVAMNPEDKIAMMAPRIVEASPDGQGEILMTREDAAQMGAQLLEAARKLYETRGIQSQLIISNENIKSRGGFVLRKGNIEYNNTYEALLKSCKEELESQVAEILFADETREQG